MISYKDRLESLSPENIEKHRKAYQLPIVEACIDFIERYCFTYNPRLDRNKTIPFFLFEKQREYIKWIFDRWKNKESGLTDKCRDVGATWCFIAFSSWLLLFQKETSVGLYTYKADECDKMGDKSTLFGKLRVIIENLPVEFTQGVKSHYFYIQSEFTGSDIAGASGDNPGRGGRRSIIFKDEEAFYEHAEMVEAALSEASDCIIGVSTHAGTNTLFYNKIISNSCSVFVFNWQDNPLHTQDWYDKKKEKAISEGLLHIFQREIERNPGASVANVVMPFDWARACIQEKYIVSGKTIAGFDVADGGTDTHAIFIMRGNEVIYLEDWGDGDSGDAAERAFWIAVDHNCDELRYDNIGIGAGAKVAFRKALEKIESNQNKSDKEMKAIKMKLIGWSASGEVVRKKESDFDDKENGDLFENAKSQAYWKAREELRNTFRFMNGKEFDKTKVISFYNISKSNPVAFNKFIREISQPQYKSSSSGRILIDKKPNGSKSPNICEAFIICRAEMEDYKPQIIIM